MANRDRKSKTVWRSNQFEIESEPIYWYYWLKAEKGFFCDICLCPANLCWDMQSGLLCVRSVYLSLWYYFKILIKSHSKKCILIQKIQIYNRYLKIKWWSTLQTLHFGYEILTVPVPWFYSTGNIYVISWSDCFKHFIYNHDYIQGKIISSATLNIKLKILREASLYTELHL